LPRRPGDKPDLLKFSSVKSGGFAGETRMDVEHSDPSVLPDMPLFAGVNVPVDIIVSWPQGQIGLCGGRRLARHGSG
jgi:hypothetical protein